jgi:hypothetical protein
MIEKIAIFLVVLIAGSNGLYFHIGETERKCFIEEIPDETTGEEENSKTSLIIH